ncbi:GNAT family N-acetyltransferase [Variovorax paradoxus]|nr:GNAT family N-acetyltransferase [Variovorax paradoxus]
MESAAPAHIEAAAPAHCRAIAEVHVLSWQQAYAGLFSAEHLAGLSVDRREAVWREALVNGTPQLLVALVEGRVVGFIAFGPSRDEGAAPDCAEVWALYLAPACWSQGTGRALWLAALQRIRAQACSSVSLWVLAGNARARRFYEAAGFAPDAGSMRELTIGSARVGELRYVLALTLAPPNAFQG